jgi:transcriptional regulator with XRE-family HTH domain
VARGWSQQKLADELGYSERYIGQLERGTKSPTLRTIADVAEVFSTKPSTILRAAERRRRTASRMAWIAFCRCPALGGLNPLIIRTLGAKSEQSPIQEMGLESANQHGWHTDISKTARGDAVVR